MVKVFLSLLIAIFLFGCSYTFQGSGSDLPPDIKKISIPFVENNSTEPGLSDLVGEALRDQFEKFGVLTVVDEDQNPDAILHAKILSVNRQTDTVEARSDSAMQLNTSIIISAEIKRPNGQLLWQNPKLRISKSVGADKASVVTSSVEFAGSSIGSKDLAALTDRELVRGQEQNAFQDLADQAAKQIYDDAVTPDF